MSKFKKLIDKSVLDGDAKTMNKITAIIDEHLMELETEHPDMCWDVIAGLHEAVYGEHFDEVMAMYAVTDMKNKDGTEGAHWTLEETTSVAVSEGIVFGEDVSKFDWFYTLNMIYSDYYGVIGSSTDVYIKMAKAFLMDKDVRAGGSCHHWSEVVC